MQDWVINTEKNIIIRTHVYIYILYVSYTTIHQQNKLVNPYIKYSQIGTTPS